MNRVRYHHLGGALIADHGPIPLAAARGLAVFYARESDAHGQRGHVRASRECAARSRSLSEAIAAATSWRRAAGWAEPDMADRRGDLIDR